MDEPAPRDPDDVLISRRVDAPFAHLGEISRFVGRFFWEVVQPPYNVTEVVRLTYELGVKTLPLITLTGLITGLVFTQQSRPSLASFGAESWLPSLVATGIVRSLAPLITALLCAGKIGSSIGAELSSMKVTEQIEALEVSAVDPYRYLVVTRTVATTVSIPILTAYFGLVAFCGAYANVALGDGMSWVAFIKSAFSVLELLDVFGAAMRAVAFGFTIGIVSARAGFLAGAGTRGVGRAANAAVVQAMIVIFLEEIFIVQILTALRALGA